MKVPESDLVTILTNALLFQKKSLSFTTSRGNELHYGPRWTTSKSSSPTSPSFLPPILTPFSLHLLRSIPSTLNDACLLAKKCQSPTLFEGKLRTQSDLEVGFCKRCCSRVFEEGDGEGRVEELHDSVVDWYRRVEELGHGLAVGVVTRGRLLWLKAWFLYWFDCSKETKEKSVAAISRISIVDSSKHVLVAEGLLLLIHLLRVLDSGSGFEKEKACVALQALSFSKENASAIGSRGGISSLLEISQAGTPGSQASAVGILRNLAGFAEMRENFIEENGLMVLLGLASSGTALSQENAIGCLCNLVSGNESLKLLVVKEGRIECLKNFWDSSPSARSLEVTVDFLST